MNTVALRKYAPKARRAFMEAVSARAQKLGLNPDKPVEVREAGEVYLIGGQPWGKEVGRQRERLIQRIEAEGFAQVMEALAYTWFNRFAAIRYMELHGYLDHGFRVLSHPQGGPTPEIIEHVQHLDLEGLDRNRALELKLAGDRDEELYRQLVLAQCHALHIAMPFLFEAIDDATELLLPENLLRTDSVVYALVTDIPESDWEDVEIIGWLYQFYISEKKDQVIGKVVKSEDIPAATQLFTPNWIVQYLVQNSVGRQWLQAYPGSTLKGQMPYYIEPAEQTAEVNAQLAEITPSRISPESIKVLDPACGSGHILVEAYKTLRAIYKERGYRSRDIPKLILKHNLFGLDIDDRAGQLAGFALMMLAREDDRNLFSGASEDVVRLNIFALQETGHLDLQRLWQSIDLGGEWERGKSQGLFEYEQLDLSSMQSDERYQLLERTLDRFNGAKTFGSLIDIPAEENGPLLELLKELEQLARYGDSIQRPDAQTLIPFVQQAQVLAQRYDVVVANPPYMGGKGMNKALKDFIKKAYPNSKSDLFACMKERGFELLASHGLNAMIVMESWMFLSSYQEFRETLVQDRTILDLVHMPYSGRGRTPLGINFGTSASIISKKHFTGFKGHFSCLRFYEIDQEGVPLEFPCENERHRHTVIDDFKKIPGSPIAYWLSSSARDLFASSPSWGERSNARQGLATADNDRFLRFWPEVSLDNTYFKASNRDEAKKSERKWFPYNKGGKFRKWYGNQEYVVNWENDGQELHAFKPRAVIRNPGFYFKECVSWSDVTSSENAFRYYPSGFIHDSCGHSIFDLTPSDKLRSLAFCNNKFASDIINVLNPTLHFHIGYFDSLPYPDRIPGSKFDFVSDLIDLSKSDWDSFETSWDFWKNPLIERKCNGYLADSFLKYFEESNYISNLMKSLEELSNKIFQDAYGSDLIDNVEVDIDRVAIFRNPAHRYGANLGAEELKARYQSDTLVELVSYSIGCIMGRYSLDRGGFVYAHSGSRGFAELTTEGAYRSFSPDRDGILPLTAQERFSDDAAFRFEELIRVVWGDENLQGNLSFVAESLCMHAIKLKPGESPSATLRRYLSTQFYSDHLKTYKKRPIYWLFSSGRQKAFECLVYLHRYNEGTLARMRMEYVVPLQSRLQARLDDLATSLADTYLSTTERKKLQQESDIATKQLDELRRYDEKLRHYADQRISLDLDDGVKVNYGKFGGLLAEVKAVTGEAAN